MRVRVRMYRQGLGDCFLLSFGEPPDVKHILIDCGTLGATSTGIAMSDVASDIADATGGHLDLVIATHEHKDHLSGFVSEDQVFARGGVLAIDRVWQAWTEDPADELAQSIKKYDADLEDAAHLGAAALRGSAVPPGAGDEAMAELGLGIDDLLGFRGDIERLGADFAPTVHEAMTFIGEQGAERTFLAPGNAPLALSWLPGVRVYVLGPPRDAAAIGRLGDHGASDLVALAARHAGDLATSARFAASNRPLAAYLDTLDVEGRQRLERVLPFDRHHRLEPGACAEAVCAAYDDAAEAWRRIDVDWLAGAGELALQLDSRTNNTSLALAFEIGDGGPVLLFPGDAQLGNWRSWHEAVDDRGDPLRNPDGTPVVDDAGNRPPRTWRIADGDPGVTTADLLKRTVLYKVGHHASHNATLGALGLDLMPGGASGAPNPTGRRLTAMIPVDRKVALGKNPKGSWDMPARALYERLIAQTHGRVLRSDIGWATRAEADFDDLFTAERWAAFEAEQQAAEAAGDVTVERLYVEWTMP